MDNTPRIIKIGDAISQLINVTFLPSHRRTTANESISGRAHRSRWVRVERIIDFIFSPIESNHCMRSYHRDIERAKKLLESHCA